ncbi:MAG: amidohydrolase family protein [Acidimicrobiales bacterium]
MTRVISTDTHIVEPPDIYEDGMPAAVRDRAPNMRRYETEDGRPADAWFLGDEQVVTLGSVTQAGRRFGDKSELDFVSVWEDVREGAYQPDAMLEDLELDGVWGALAQPSQGLFWYHLDDSELLSGICLAYNNWIAEFSAKQPERLLGVAMLNVDDPREAAKEIERCSDLGLRAAFIPVAPTPGQPYRDPIYDPFWDAAQQTGTVLMMHIATQRANVPACEITTDFSTYTPAGLRPTQDYWVRYAMTDMIFAGVLERYPGLRIVSTENEGSWAPHWLRQMDYTYTDRPVYANYKSAEGFLPSDYFRRNMFIIFQEDPAVLKLRYEIGIDNLMWGNDYPHSESTWPKSMEFLDEMFEDVPDQERQQILDDNAVRVFGFPEE